MLQVPCSSGKNKKKNNKMGFSSSAGGFKPMKIDTEGKIRRISAISRTIELLLIILSILIILKEIFGE